MLRHRLSTRHEYRQETATIDLATLLNNHFDNYEVTFVQCDQIEQFIGLWETF